MAIKPYAYRTTVSAGKTQADIRRMVEKYGGQWVGVVTDPDKVHQVDQLVFKLAGAPIRFEVHHPHPENPAEYRRRWREIWLVIKSRLVEAVQLKRDVKEVFMAQLVTKTGKTVWEMSQLDMPGLLSGGSLREMLSLEEGRGDD